MGDRELDGAVDDSFPASDPPAMAEPADTPPEDAKGKQRGVQGSQEKDPEEWTTGDEPMTGAQAAYLETLSRQAGVEFDRSLTKAEASKRIDELKRQTGRGIKS
jgi:hypothetical protein